MKRYLAIGLLLVSPQAAAVLLGSQSDAVECTLAMRAATVEQMKAALREASARVLQHFNVLNQELGRRKKVAATETAIAEVDATAQQLGSLIQIMQAGDGTINALELASLLAAIREQVVYGGDKAAANARLAPSLSVARQEAEKALQYIGPASKNITLPGVAADVAKMRDAIEAVIKALGRCAPPPQATPRQ